MALLNPAWIRSMLQEILDADSRDIEMAKESLVLGLAEEISRIRSSPAQSWFSSWTIHLPESVRKELVRQAVKAQGDIRLPGELHENLRDLVTEKVEDRRIVRWDRRSRQQSGSFFTPESIVSFIIERALGPSMADIPQGTLDEIAPHIRRLSVLDPAMGAGFFLIQAARYLAKTFTEKITNRTLESENQIRQLVARCLHGVDVDPIAVSLARWAVIMECSLPSEDWPTLDQRLRTGDALLMDDVRRYDAVVGNPPYESAARSPMAAAYRRRFAATTKGKLNLYRFFLHLGLERLAEHEQARLGFIVPSTLASDPSASALRDFIAKGWHVEEMVRFREETGVFDGVTQAALIAIVAPNIGITRSDCLIREVHRPLTIEESKPVVVPWISIHRREIPGHSWALSGQREAYTILDRIRDSKRSLLETAGDSFHTGEIQLDLHRSNVIPAHQAAAERDHAPLIHGSAAQRYEMDPPHYLIRLPKNGNVGPADKVRIAVRRTVNINASRRIQAVMIEGTPERPIFLENGFSYCIPTTCGAGALLALLNSRLVDYWFRLINANNHVNAGQLNALRIPDWNRGNAHEELDHLGRERAGLKSTENPERCRRIDEEIDRILFEMYDLTNEVIHY